MGPITGAVLETATVLTANGLTLLTSWLQIRWQAQQEHAHHQNLVTMVQALLEGGQLPENCSNGTGTCLAVTCSGHEGG
jgi:hypothetical protein